MKLISERTHIPVKNSHKFVLQQLRLLEEFKLEAELLIEGKNGEILYRIEQETTKLLEFIYTVTDFPFFTDIADFDLEANQIIEPMLCNLEEILDCLIIYEVAPKDTKHEEQKTKESPLKS